MLSIHRSMLLSWSIKSKLCRWHRVGVKRRCYRFEFFVGIMLVSNKRGEMNWEGAIVMWGKSWTRGLWVKSSTIFFWLSPKITRNIHSSFVSLQTSQLRTSLFWLLSSDDWSNSACLQKLKFCFERASFYFLKGMNGCLFSVQLHWG